MASGVSSSSRSHIFRPYKSFGVLVYMGLEVCADSTVWKYISRIHGGTVGLWSPREKVQGQFSLCIERRV